jgi:hypothetical protein
VAVTRPDRPPTTAPAAGWNFDADVADGGDWAAALPTLADKAQARTITTWLLDLTWFDTIRPRFMSAFDANGSRSEMQLQQVRRITFRDPLYALRDFSTDLEMICSGYRADELKA